MADPKIQIRRSSVPEKIPTTSQLSLGEIAINTYDGILYIKKDVNGAQSIVSLGSRGLQGTTGTSIQGTTGTSIQGIQGIQGTTGTSIQGITGTSVQGIQGTTGTSVQGIQGTTGTSIQGIQGIQGTTGTSIQGTAGTSVQGIQGTSGGGGSTSIVNDISTNLTRYPTFVDVTTGSPTATNVSSSKFTFNPSTGTLSATVFTALSDKFNKNNIKLISSPIEKLNAIDGVTFNWIDTEVSSVGLIAQQVENIFPELIAIVDNKKTVNYNGIIALLVECVKDLSKEIEILKSDINL